MTSFALFGKKTLHYMESDDWGMENESDWKVQKANLLLNICTTEHYSIIAMMVLLMQPEKPLSTALGPCLGCPPPSPSFGYLAYSLFKEVPCC